MMSETEGHDREQLARENEALREEVGQLRRRLSTCPITGLGNEISFQAAISALGESPERSSTQGAFCIISLDHTNQTAYTYGEEAIRDALKGAASILRSVCQDEASLFRVEGHTFAAILHATERTSREGLLEECRTRIQDSSSFVSRITISAGGVHFDESGPDQESPDAWKSWILGAARYRMKQAKARGMNCVVWDMQSTNHPSIEKPVLIIEDDPMLAKIIIENCSASSIMTQHVMDGQEALKIMEDLIPGAVISDVSTPKVNGLDIRRIMLQRSDLRHVPFVMLTSYKTSDVIQQSLPLRIVHILQKPIFVNELMGIIFSYLARDEDLTGLM